MNFFFFKTLNLFFFFSPEEHCSSSSPEHDFMIHVLHQIKTNPTGQPTHNQSQHKILTHSTLKPLVNQTHKSKK